MKEFERIIGYENIKTELERTCDIMKHKDKYARLGVSIPRGLLLSGDPGLGKTLMANCLIKESEWNVMVCRKDKPNGDFVKEIKDVFTQAKENVPSIVFLDDMDKFANEDEYHCNADEFVTIQSCIDECKGLDVFILATVNDKHNLPKSLLRAGRFDKIISVKAPNRKDAPNILRHYLQQKKYVEDIDVEAIACIMSNSSCAQLETIVNEAGIYAGFAGKEKIDMDDMIKACMRVVFNAPENNDDRDEAVLKKIAYHEAGHAVVGELLEPGSVSIISVQNHAGDIGGITGFVNENDYFYFKSRMENRVISLLAGKAAIEIAFGEVDVGANSDLHRAFDIVERFVDHYCSTSFDRWEQSNRVSNDLVSRREMQITCEMERYYYEAKRMLVANRQFLDEVAIVLMQKSILTSKDISQIKQAFKVVV